MRASVAGASKQAYQMAEQLEKAAAKAGVLEQMQQGQQAAEQAGSILQQQMQGALNSGPASCQSLSATPKAARRAHRVGAEALTLGWSTMYAVLPPTMMLYG